MDIFEDISGVLAVTSFDPNDTFATAATITEGTYDIQGNGEDWYSFTSPAGNMSFSLTAAQNLLITLNDADGNTIVGRTTPTGAASFDFTNTIDQTYFLRVATAQYANLTPPADLVMTYTLNIDLPEAVLPDGNDTRDTAQTLTEGRHVISGTAVDWFRLASLSGTIGITLDTAATANPQNLNAVLYNAAGQVVGSDPGNTTGDESFTALAPQAGDYFLKVFWAGAPDSTSTAVSLDYTLDIDLPQETVRGPDDPGETRATATPIPANGTHSIVGTGMDWFRIDTGPGRFTIDMTDTSAGVAGTVDEINMDLYDSTGTLLLGNRATGGTETVSFLSLTGGTYYIQMSSPQYPNGTPNGVSMRYDLTVDLPQNTWATALDFGPIRNASIAAFDIDNDGKDEIFVGASKALDTAGNEIRPGGLIVLEDDGTVKWSRTFDAIDGPDPLTGKRYNTTSVSTQPVFSDLDGDGSIDILVGVGAGVTEDFDTPGQPGDKGGLYALNADGTVKWFHQTRDVFGSALDKPEDGPDGRPEGVYATPRVFDTDADGQREVLLTSWDHRLYILDGKTGGVEREFDLHDTASATPNVADLNGDGLYEIIVTSDITDNTRAGIETQGGIVQALTNYGQPIIAGWTDQVSVAPNPSADYRGEFVEQALWSSPKIADLDRDGSPEIIHGTSNFFKDARGQFIKIWNADGTERATLATTGQTRAAPLLADLDGNGSLEIIATTVEGYVYGWNAGGTQLFRTLVQPYIDPDLDNGEVRVQPINRQAVAVDLDNADGDLEIIVTVGAQAIVLDSDGTQITATTRENSNNIFQAYAGSPLAKDIDGDGRLDLLSGGTVEGADQAIVFRWENPLEAGSGNFRTAEYQSSQSLHEIRNFVERLYDTILGRAADAYGGNDWTDKLASGVRSGADVAAGFIGSPEFQNRGTTDAQYVNTLYAAFFDRAADQGGFDAWMRALAGGADRADVLDGFTGSREFSNLTGRFGIRAENSFGASDDAAVQLGDANDSNVLRGGAGNNLLNDEGGAIEEPDNATQIDQSGQVYRLYGATLGRGPDAGGFTGWLNGLSSGSLQLEQVAGAFVNSPEFQNTYGALDNTAFVNLLYENVLGRAADAGGLQNWLDALADGRTREQVVLGFSESAEYRRNTVEGLDDFMRRARVEWIDVLEGGAGDDVMNGGMGSDIFVFRAGQTGNDIIHGFEPWDQLQLSGYGFDTAAEAIARMSQQGANVVFAHQGQNITFVGSQLGDMNRVYFNI